jgi:MFS family permease
VSHFAAALGFSAFSLLPKYLLTARGLRQGDTGPIAMAVPLGSLAAAPLVAWALGRWPKTVVARAGALTFAGVAAALAQRPPIAALPVLSALGGAAVMAVFAAGSALMADVAEPGRMARALGLHGAAGMLGHAIGPQLLEPLADRAGWPSAFAAAASAALVGALVPLPTSTPAVLGDTPRGRAVLKPLALLLTVSGIVGLMHNALWVSHQPLVLARGGRDVASYFFGMSAGGLIMRIGFGSLPDRIGVERSTRLSLLGYLAATLAMTWVTPSLLGVLGLMHGLAHGVFYPSIAARCTAAVPSHTRGAALTALYACFNVGATLGSFGFARVGEAWGPASVFPLAFVLGLSALPLAYRGAAR